MKKTRLFIFITALLITLLMVVGCDVSPVSINDRLVRASIAVSNSRDLQVVGGDSTISSYKIAMIPEWESSSTSDPIVGKKGSRTNGVVDGWEAVSYSIENENISIDLGYVSQGKWSIYLNAYNSAGNLIYSGTTTSYLNKNSTDVVIVMKRATSDKTKGYLYFFISLNRLNLSDTNQNIVDGVISENNNIYRMGYEIIDSNGVSESGYIPLNAINDTHAIFGDDETPIALDSGEYTVIVSLLKKDNNGVESVIGGITKLASIYPGNKEDRFSWILVRGDVTPSDFIQVGIDFPAPEVTAEVIYSETDDVYTCEDTFNKISGYDRFFRWFIDGELIEESVSYTKWTVRDITTNGNKSTMSCSFSKLGEREVRCEVVYIPNGISGIDSDPLHFVGGDSYYVQVLSKSN